VIAAGTLAWERLVTDKDILMAVTQEVAGSSPNVPATIQLYVPERSFTERSGEIVYTFGPKGLCKGCRVFSSKSI
jgi:hypothetical protein